MERVSDERLKQLIYYFGDEVGVEIEDCLKELQQLRAALPKVRGALEFYANEDNYKHQSKSGDAEDWVKWISEDAGDKAQQALALLDSLEVKK